jgi:ATP-dependent Zn protease
VSETCLQVHLAGRPVAEDIDLRTIAFETTKYTGAQLANLVNTAGGFVGKAGREAITTADLQHVRATLRSLRDICGRRVCMTGDAHKLVPALVS